MTPKRPKKSKNAMPSSGYIQKGRIFQILGPKIVHFWIFNTFFWPPFFNLKLDFCPRANIGAIFSKFCKKFLRQTPKIWKTGDPWKMAFFGHFQHEFCPRRHLKIPKNLVFYPNFTPDPKFSDCPLFFINFKFLHFWVIFSARVFFVKKSIFFWLLKTPKKRYNI